MQIAFIEQDQTERACKEKELESVDRPWEDSQQPSVNQKRSKLKKMRGFVRQLRANLGKANEDLA
jgi:hypothetical protein